LEAIECSRAFVYLLFYLINITTMKKNYLLGITWSRLSVVLIITLFGFSQKALAQLNGITVSDGSSEVWYYIESGHSANGHITNNDGRFGGLINANGSEADGAKADIDLVRPTGERQTQKWKVVAVPGEDGFYYLINQRGEYFYRGTGSSYASPSATGDEAKYNLVPVVGTPYYTIRRKGRADDETKLEVRNGGGTNGWGFFESNNAVVAQAHGLTNSPRSWRFVPEADVDTFYPVIYPQGTTADNVTAWYYIKNLDPSASAHYLTLTETGFALQEKSTTEVGKQLFGLIGNGKIAATSATGGHVTHIVNQADPTKYLNQATAGTAYDWYIEHVVKPDEGIMQNTLRTNRNGSFLISAGNGIAIQATTADNSTDATTLDTYNSVYNWAFEAVQDVTVTVSAGANVTIVSTTPALTGNSSTVEYGKSFTVVYTIDAGYVPGVRIDGDLSGSGTTSDGSTYTLTIDWLTEDKSIEISAEVATYTVTVDAVGVTILSPVLDNNQYTSGASSVITFELNEGYENLQITATAGAVAGQPVLTTGVYSVTVSNITGATTVTIAATLKTLPITVVKNDAISWEGNPEESVEYFGDYTLSFTVSAGYYPLIYINDVSTPTPAANEGIYTLALTGVKAAQKIIVWAFAQNVLPVTADTYVGGGNKSEIVYANEKDFRIQRINTSPQWTLRSYLQFDVPQFIKAAGYDKAGLQLVFKNVEKTAAQTLLLEVREAAITGEMADLTWTINGEQNVALVDPALATELLPYSANAVHVVDVSTVLIGNNLSEPIILQLSANETTQTNSDGWYSFYSHEGAVEANLDYVPTLIFSKATAIATPPEGPNDALDAVVDTKYYTLQGVEVKAPLEDGIYIVKKVYESARTKVVKTWIRK
jgi:hypothetical protein